MLKPILIAASPNTEEDDLNLSKKYLFKSSLWYDESKTNKIEDIIGKDFSGKAFAFDSARSAFYVYLKSLDLPKNSEVILPAFSCMVIANSVLWAGLTPVFVDCNKDDFNYDFIDLQKKLSDKTKVVLVQHSFGFPEDLKGLRTIVGSNILIVEDLAHSLGGFDKDGNKLGALADASILTFGIEKVISGVRGGMLIVRGDDSLAEKIKMFKAKLPIFPKNKTFIALLNPILWSIITPVYYLGIGKFTIGRLIVYLSHLFGIFGIMIEDCEYKQCKPDWLPSKISPVLSELALNQYQKLSMLNTHRFEIANQYIIELGLKNVKFNTVYLRFPIRVNNRQKVIEITKKNGIVLGDWYKTILYAPKNSLESLGYRMGSCPTAELLSEDIVNLPTHIKVNKEDALRIAQLIKPYIKK